MQLSYDKNKVLNNEEIYKGIFKMDVEGKFDVKAGQFYMLRSWENEPYLSRPISIHDVNENSISFLYEVRGEGTKLLSKLKKYDEIQMLGPVGNGFDIDNINGKVAVVTGGIGIAPMFLTIKELKKRNIYIDIYSGFREDSYSIDSIKEYVNNVYISTESGNEGHKGYVTDILDVNKYDMVLCCGPEVMMKKVTDICIENGVKVYVSMESKMACGVGACLGCTCKTKIGNKRTCKDGPVFDGRDVIYA